MDHELRAIALGRRFEVETDAIADDVGDRASGAAVVEKQLGEPVAAGAELHDRAGRNRLEDGNEHVLPDVVQVAVGRGHLPGILNCEVG
jgi:hypothetical protein